MKGKKSGGGRTNMKVSGNPDVFKEAEERKKGGRAKRASGGKVEGKVVGLMTGGAVRPRSIGRAASRRPRRRQHVAALDRARHGGCGKDAEPERQQQLTGR
jgi:hypothetical protein